jgi:diguanylate cyclase (GGDEF)-like protein
VAGLRSDSTCEVTGGKRLESLLDQIANNDLDLHILSYSQRHDPQTGLLNHRAFQDDLATLYKYGPPKREIALIWIDLLNMRREFSLLGLAGSEALARRVTGTLRSAVDSSALLGRVGGRSFLVAIEASKLDKADRRRIQAVMDALTPPQRGSETRPEVAAGVAFLPSDTNTVEDLIRFASLAAARANYIKSRHVVAFHSRMNSMIVRDHMLEVEMNKGLDQGQFCMVYQPKVDLITGQVLGAEALIRWKHPELGSVPPSEFIPIAERSDLIHRIFEFGLRTALEQTRRWRDLGLSVPIVAVNASAVNLRSNDFARTVRNIMVEIPVAPMQLELEMTESLAFDDEDLFTARMRQLKAIGVRVAIDDFGTRYTGFDVLKKIPMNTMKIDQCFIRGIDRSEDIMALCQTIVAMARQLKLNTVAEGIEEPGELAAMRQIGCEAGQGYLFQRPIPADEFTAFLRDWPQRMSSFGFSGNTEIVDADSVYAIG